MGVKYSGKIISIGRTVADYKDSPSGPVGGTLVQSYEASQGTFPTDQGWSGPNTNSSIVDDGGELSLRKGTVSATAFYSGSSPSRGWMIELDIKVEVGQRYAHGIYIEPQRGYDCQFTFYPDRLTAHRTINDERTIAQYDFQTKYVNVKLLDNTETNTIEVYFDNALITDSWDIFASTGSNRTLWGDSFTGNSANLIAYWRNLYFYDGWTK